MNLTFCCSRQNNLFQLLTKQKCHYPRYNEIASALEQAPYEGGLLLLSDKYPKMVPGMDERHLRLISNKRLRVSCQN